jgi:hypothetical protein
MRVVLSLLLVAGAVSGQMLRGSSPPLAGEQAPAVPPAVSPAETPAETPAENTKIVIERVDPRTGLLYIYPGRRASAADAGPPTVTPAESPAESIGKIERVDPRTGLTYLIYPGRRV